MSTLYPYTYAGVVESNQDPLELGRLKVRVPHVFGTSVSGAGYIGVNDLPWAMPVGMPAGGSEASGGFSLLPAIGDKVMVRFLDGEPEKPIWEWGMQTLKDAAALGIHQYDSGTPVGPPNRTILTRYGHSLSITESGINLTTKEGYQLLLKGSTDTSDPEKVYLQTPNGQSLVLNDMTGSTLLQGLNSSVISAEKVILNAGSKAMIRATNSLNLMVGGTNIIVKGKRVSITTGTGASILIDDAGNLSVISGGGASVTVEKTKVQLSSPTGSGGVVVEDGKVSVSAPEFVMNTAAVSFGMGAGFPVMMMTPEMVAWILGHTHEGVMTGSGTSGAPVRPDPAFPASAASKTVQTS